ncbi:MAG: class I SAM-dependent methyltransferase [Chlamydiia bacterium]|nr:class I SAM-dependent methyltransferase [Chlamydiia bacterium]
MNDRHVAVWRGIFDRCYRKGAEEGNRFMGWQSSYTGEAIPREEMEAWIGETVGRIQEFAPRKVYEIGVGMGLIMFPLLEGCERYCATDFSGEAIAYLRDNVSDECVRFYQREADDGTAFGEEDYDMFIMNSVVQYFPSLEYLERVIGKIVEKIASGGVIFIGDVRDRRLVEAFYASVEIYRGERGIREGIVMRKANDMELSVDPGFFEGLKGKFQRISHVEMRLKKGIVQNELTKFRYDVILHVEGEATGFARKEKGVPNYSVRGIFRALECLESASLDELREMIDFEKASEEWRKVYEQFPGAEPLIDQSDEKSCSLGLRS